MCACSVQGTNPEACTDSAFAHTNNFKEFSARNDLVPINHHVEMGFALLGLFRRRVTAETDDVDRRLRRSGRIAFSTMGAAGSGALRPRMQSSAAGARLIRAGRDGTATGDDPNCVSAVSAELFGKRVLLSANRGSELEPGAEPNNADGPSTVERGDG